jgi:drug/metabolite transporter (DMT)-like permease
MSRRAWLAFVAVSILWGTPYLFIKLAVQEVSPTFVAWSRVLVAALVLLPIAWRLGAFAGLRGRLRAVIAYAALEIAIPFTLIPLGETLLSSSLTAILISSMPLWVALLSLRFAPQERLSGTRVIGLVIGLAGVVSLMGVTVGGRPVELLGAGCIIVATLCYAASPILINRSLADLHPLGPVTAALVICSVVLTPFALASRPAALPTTTGLVSLAVLGVVCTALALAVYFFLVTEAGPGRASIITYVNPAVAVLLGVVVLGESMSLLTAAELLLIAAGSWLATDGRLPPGLSGQVHRLRTVLRNQSSRRRGQAEPSRRRARPPARAWHAPTHGARAPTRTPRS